MDGFEGMGGVSRRHEMSTGPGRRFGVAGVQPMTETRSEDSAGRVWESSGAEPCLRMRQSKCPQRFRGEDDKPRESSVRTASGRRSSRARAGQFTVTAVQCPVKTAAKVFAAASASLNSQHAPWHTGPTGISDSEDMRW